MKGTIAIIIPTYNRKEHLHTVLSCINCQILDEYLLKTIVIVDGSTDGTLDLLEKVYPEIEVIHGNGNWWYTKCINAGIDRAIELEAKFILTLNDDIIFDKYYLSHLIDVMELQMNPSVVGSASFTHSFPHRITFSGINKVNKWNLKEKSNIKKFSIIEPSSLSGFVPSVNLSGRGMLIHKAIIEKIGKFDVKLVQYGSDTDFSYRASKMGYKVFISYDAKIFEKENLTSKGVAYNKPGLIEYYKSFFNRYTANSLEKSIYYFIKHGKYIYFPLFFLQLIMGSLYVYFFKYKE